jgi:hypothetical protein
MWRMPATLLAKDISISPHSVSILGGVIQGHLLCADEEYPLISNQKTALIVRSGHNDDNKSSMLTDRKVFGAALFDEA